MRYFLIILTALFFFSCTTARKAVQWFNEHELEASNFCAFKFPVKDSIVTHYAPIVRQANNPDYTKKIDSLNSELAAVLDGATVDSINALHDLKTCQEVVAKQARTIKGLKRVLESVKADYQPCKPDTVIKTVDHFTENTARVRTLELALDKMTGDRNKYSSKYRFWLKAAIVGWGILILLAFLTIYRSSLPFKL